MTRVNVQPSSMYHFFQERSDGGGNQKNEDVENLGDDSNEENENKTVWTDHPEEEYFKTLLREQQQEQQQGQLQQNPEPRQDPPLKTRRGKRQKKNLNDHDDDDDDDSSLPNAIKLMDTISIDDKHTKSAKDAAAASRQKQQSKKKKKADALEKLFGDQQNHDHQPPPAPPQVKTIDDDNDKATEKVSVCEDDFTINQMIREVEQQEEAFWFGATATATTPATNSLGQEQQPSSSLPTTSTLHTIKRSLLHAMNAGVDDKSTNDSLAGNETVNNIIGNMENESVAVDDETRTYQSWNNFQTMAASVATGYLTRHTTASRQSYFVNDETSVGSSDHSEENMEVVIRKKASSTLDKQRPLTREHSQDDGGTEEDGSLGNANTLVSSLSYDETYFRVGQLPPGALPPTQEEETPWWILAEQLPATDSKTSSTGSKATPEQSKHVPITTATTTKELPQTPSTVNSDGIELQLANDDAPWTPLDHQDLQLQSKQKEKESSRSCFLLDALRKNNAVRYVLLASAIFFAVFAGLGIAMLITDSSEENRTTEHSSPAAEDITIPPFRVDGTNVIFDYYDNANATADPSTSSPTWLGEEDQDDTTINSTDSPTEAATDLLYTLSPSEPAALTTAPDMLLEMIRQRLPDSFEKMQDPSSPQYRALEWMFATPPDQDILDQPARIAQRWVLAVLYFSTEGEQWVNSARWLSSDNECDWYSTNPGEICDSDGLVKQIDLRRNGLQNSIPEEILLLDDNLVSIRVNGNSLSSTIPEWLGQMSNLARLHVNGNLHTGTIPAALGALTELWSLRLGQMSLEGTLPTQLGLLTQLEYLVAASNRLTGTIPTEMGNLSNLLDLELFDNDLTGTIPTEFGLLTSAASIELGQNSLQGSLSPETCTQLGAPSEVDIQVDCDRVSCSCCSSCS